jgi:hypothetical protein
LKTWPAYTIPFSGVTDPELIVGCNRGGHSSTVTGSVPGGLPLTSRPPNLRSPHSKPNWRPAKATLLQCSIPIEAGAASGTSLPASSQVLSTKLLRVRGCPQLGVQSAAAQEQRIESSDLKPAPVRPLNESRSGSPAPTGQGSLLHALF